MEPMKWSVQKQEHRHLDKGNRYSVATRGDISFRIRHSDRRTYVHIHALDGTPAQGAVMLVNYKGDSAYPDDNGVVPKYRIYTVEEAKLACEQFDIKAWRETKIAHCEDRIDRLSSNIEFEKLVMETVREKLGDA